ncbi:MAG: class I SAM-dependent methyltransferase [Pseudomonadota bacterium]
MTTAADRTAAADAAAAGAAAAGAALPPAAEELVAVGALDAADQPAAQLIADQTGLALLPVPTDVTRLSTPQLVLLLAEGELVLQQSGRKAPGPVSADFGNAAMRHRRRGGQNELLGRAVGVGKKPVLAVADVTAGLGRDAFVLADLGCRVTLVEREAVAWALLDNALKRAAASSDTWLVDTAARMQLLRGDACKLGNQLADVDVIYLDPMFPSREKSASVKKEMAIFQTLLQRSETLHDAAALLDWALSQSVARVVVKRPLRAPALAGSEPSHRLCGRAVRFDVYTLAAMA